MLRGRGYTIRERNFRCLLKRIGVEEKEAETSKWLLVKKIGIQFGKTKSGGLEANWELEIIDTVTGLYT